MTGALYFLIAWAVVSIPAALLIGALLDVDVRIMFGGTPDGVEGDE